MSRHRIPLAIAALLFTTIIAACNLPTGTPACAPEDLVAPELVSPAPYSVISWTPMTGPLPPNILEWSYPDDCQPDQFTIEISERRDFANRRSGSADGDKTGWPDPDAAFPQMGLRPATEYFWRVRAQVGETLGPWSTMRVFFTGQECTSASELPVPDLIEPDDGEVLESVLAELFFQVPDGGCLPQGYFADLQTDPDFEGESLIGELGVPANSALTGELEDCTSYYWRIAAVFDGERGPFSEIRSFQTRASETCPDAALTRPTPPPLVRFCAPEDLIAPELVAPGNHAYVGEEPLDSSYPGMLQWTYTGTCLPEGYRVELSKDIDFAQSWAAETSGGETSWPPDLPIQSLDPGSEYWWRVAAKSGGEIGPYSSPRAFFTAPWCAAASEMVAPQLVSPEDGATLNSLMATLHYLPGEPACLPDGYYIDLQTDPSFSGTTDYGLYELPGTTLITDPLEDCTSYFWRVAPYVNGEQGPFSEPRWFFINETGACLRPIPWALGLQDLNCRFGPGTAYEVIGFLLEGQASQVVARNRESTWLVIESPIRGGTCWVARSLVRTFGDPDALEVWTPPPLPTPTPTAVPLVCTESLTQSQCEAAGGTWVPLVSRPPYCSCP